MRKLSLSLVALALTACGGGAAQPTTPTTATSTPSASAPTPVASSVASASPSAVPAVDNDPPDSDPNESATPIAMPALLTKATAKSSFPKKTIGDRECWQATALSGAASKDFATIVTKCGSPTGLQEYAKPVTGHLHAKHDRRDTYQLKLIGGYCYRYFAVGDSTIADLDVLVQKPNGDLVADDKTTSPVAIVEMDKTWCADEDTTYNFQIEIDGPGKGGYLFGVWAKPK